jgi:hypothetical protein
MSDRGGLHGTGATPKNVAFPEPRDFMEQFEPVAPPLNQEGSLRVLSPLARRQGAKSRSA